MSARVAVVGPGRVGTLLAVALSRAGHRVVAVAGGSAAARERVGSLVAGVRPLASVTEAAARAQLLVLSVPDDAIEGVVRDLVRDDAIAPGQRVVHVAGARGLAPLDLARRAGAATAACHPAMTVSAGASDPELLHGTAWAVTAAAADRSWAHELVTDLGGDPLDVPEAARGLYHAGLSLGSNAVGAAVAAARQALLGAGIRQPERFLGPLAAASVTNVLDRGAAALTGPVVRGDAGTVARHLEVLHADLPALATTYRHLAAAVLAQATPGLDDDAVAALRAALEATPCDG
ncbi:Rossmann-like and DUF2520 domain-containing protein [Egicoccus halophilus]|uniref:DUF2520 domain-containing protein n=1 Tax=Egicoccus halophilus TaxID=1670830 RepID=A0A8J3A9K5_9ACTN|nr:Rossmann-like and DUF2520 domain-containing protein [Egicoccus halophilus]GGI07766.1 hypothetical protein GCM10011354_25730 [Egicoccus halophilus]